MKPPAIDLDLVRRLLEYNPYHDEEGKFTTADGAVTTVAMGAARGKNAPVGTARAAPEGDLERERFWELQRRLKEDEDFRGAFSYNESVGSAGYKAALLKHGVCWDLSLATGVNYDTVSTIVGGWATTSNKNLPASATQEAARQLFGGGGDFHVEARSKLVEGEVSRMVNKRAEDWVLENDPDVAHYRKLTRESERVAVREQGAFTSGMGETWDTLTSELGGDFVAAEGVERWALGDAASAYVNRTDGSGMTADEVRRAPSDFLLERAIGNMSYNFRRLLSEEVFTKEKKAKVADRLRAALLHGIEAREARARAENSDRHHWEARAQAQQRVLDGTYPGAPDFKGDARREVEKEYGRMVEERKKVLRAMYEVTQRSRLGEDGEGYVRLYRGMRGDIPPGGAKAFRSPAESWSRAKGTAEGFYEAGGTLLWGRFPRSRILSTYRTGLGCAEEQEYVIVGPPNDDDLKELRG